MCNHPWLGAQRQGDRKSLDMSWAREHNPFIERMKNLDFPGIDVDVAGADTVFVIGWDRAGSGNFIAEELEADLLDALMLDYYKRKEQNEREDAGQRLSKRHRDPVRARWMRYTPPPLTC